MAHVRRRTFIPFAPAVPRDALAQVPTRSAEWYLRDRGVMLPKVQTFAATHIPCARMSALVFLPGVGPLRLDGTPATGKVGAVGFCMVEEARGPARPTGLVPPATVRETAGGLNRVARVGEVFGTVDAPPGFTDHPR